MSRLPSLLENQLFEQLRILDIDFTELKNRQPTSGKSGVLAYLSQTNNTWDLSEAIASPSTTYGYSAGFTITYTGDGSQQYPIVNPFADLMFSSSISPTPSRATYNAAGLLQWSDGTNGVVVNSFLRFDNTTLSNQLVTKWTIDFTYYGSLTYYLKAYTRGSSRGSIGVVRNY